jgi:glycosyltransferase involved in cell wall biosynthesis
VKISVITVCYNSATTLEETIQSVLNQTHPDLEYIVIDGASTDGTLEIISKYRNRIQHVVSEPDKGIYDAMNKGLKLATGDIIGILNSDDLYKNNQVLSSIDNAFQSDTDCICTDVEIFKNTPSEILRYYSCTRWKPWMFRIGHQPPHPGFFVRRSCYDTLGLFDTQYKLAADFDIMFRFIYKAKKTTLFLPWVSVCMRSGGASQKGFSNIAQANREVHHSIQKNGYFSMLALVWSKYILKIFQFSAKS